MTDSDGGHWFVCRFLYLFQHRKHSPGTGYLMLKNTLITKYYSQRSLSLVPAGGLPSQSSWGFRCDRDVSIMCRTLQTSDICDVIKPNAGMQYPEMNKMIEGSAERGVASRITKSSIEWPVGEFLVAFYRILIKYPKVSGHILLTGPTPKCHSRSIKLCSYLIWFFFSIN